MLTEGKVETLKAIIDPITGCFVSPISATVVHLRFPLKALAFFRQGRIPAGAEFVKSGAARLLDTLAFVGGTDSELRRQLARERRGWQTYYNVLAALAQKKEEGRVFIEKGKAILQGTAVNQTSTTQ